jgi:hypothetical protein
LTLLIAAPLLLDAAGVEDDDEAGLLPEREALSLVEAESG